MAYTLDGRDSGSERESWKVMDLADDLAAALEGLTEADVLPGETVLSGHSMGAPVAAAAAVARRPRPTEV